MESFQWGLPQQTSFKKSSEEESRCVLGGQGWGALGGCCGAVGSEGVGAWEGVGMGGGCGPGVAGGDGGV